jgi:hypothetical protein
LGSIMRAAASRTNVVRVAYADEFTTEGEIR